MYSCCISLTQWMCILLLSEVLAKQSGPFLEFIFLFSPSSHRFSSRLFAPKHPLRTVLCPCFPFPLIKMNPGNIWTQKVPLSGEGEGHLRSETNRHRSLLHPNLCDLSFKNTRHVMVLALSGLTTVETTKVGYLHSGLERHVL